MVMVVEWVYAERAGKGASVVGLCGRASQMACQRASQMESQRASQMACQRASLTDLQRVLPYHRLQRLQYPL